MKLDVCLFLWEPAFSLYSSVRCGSPWPGSGGSSQVEGTERSAVLSVALTGPTKLRRPSYMVKGLPDLWSEDSLGHPMLKES